MAADILPLFPVHEPVRLLAPAKVNLFLDILDRRQDGYHNLDAVNVSVDLFDEIDLRLTEDGQFKVECDWPEVPKDDTNHLIRAAKEVLGSSRWGVSMKLKKRIPVGAGLGGGTADAGTLLRYLARAFNLKEKEVIHRALKVGSDVPYSFYGGPARARGRGEWVERLEGVHELDLILLDPGQRHETPRLYARLPPSDERGHPPADLFIETWRRGNLELLGLQMFNAFQDIVFAEFPRLAELRNRLLDAGCLGVCLTGTGSHLVGLWSRSGSNGEELKWEAEDAKLSRVHTLAREFPGWFQRL